MPPNQDTNVRPYGLSEAEMKASISVLRLLAIDGNTPIDKAALAKLTGHEKPNTAMKIWSMAKAKLVAADEGGSSDNHAAGNGSPIATPAKPVKRNRTGKKAGGGKKAAAPTDDDDNDDDIDAEDEPAPKRGKSKAVKEESGDESF